MKNIKCYFEGRLKRRMTLRWSRKADQLDFKANEMLKEGRTMEAKVLIAKANWLRSRTSY